MGSYTPTTWNPGAAPGISSGELNRIETGVDGAHDELNVLDGRVDGNDGDIAGHETRISDLEGAGPNPHTHDNVDSVDDGFMDNIDKQKLDTMEYDAKDDQSITGGNAITIVGTGDVTIHHQDTSNQGSVQAVGAQVFDDIDVDSYGHVTTLGLRSLTPANIGAPTTAEAMLRSDPVFTNTGIRHSSYGRCIYQPSATITHLQANGTSIVYGNGSTDLWLGGVPFASGAYDLECDEAGAARKVKYAAKASARRFKKKIKYAKLDPSKLLDIRPRSYVYKSDPEAVKRVWVVAEEVLEATGDDTFVLRDDDGEILNTQDRTFLAHLIVGYQELVARVAELESA